MTPSIPSSTGAVSSFLDDLINKAEKIVPLFDKDETADIHPAGASPTVATAEIPKPVLIIGGILAVGVLALAAKEVLD